MSAGHKTPPSARLPLGGGGHCVVCVVHAVCVCARVCTHLLQATTVVYANEEGVVHDAQLVEQGDVLVDLVDEHLALFRTQGDGLAQPVKVLVLHHHVGVVLDLIRKSERVRE